MSDLHVRLATVEDTPLILQFIKELAELPEDIDRKSVV